MIDRVLDFNACSRKVTVAHYIATVMAELDPLETDHDRLMRLVVTLGDVADTIDTAGRDLLDVLGVLAAQSQKWMETLLEERAR